MSTMPQAHPNIFTELPLTAAETGSDPRGAAAECGSKESGFGGLGLEGMVGNAPSGGLAAPRFGEGKTGMRSGDIAGGRDEEGEGNVGREEGDAEMEETWDETGVVRSRRRASVGIRE